MQLNINLDELKKSKTKFVYGVIVLLFSVGIFSYSLSSGNIYLTVYSIFFLIISINSLYESRGKVISTIFGKRFINIDEENISVKLKTLQPGQTVKWNSIESVKFGSSKIEIIGKGSLRLQIDYSELSYKVVQDLKQTIDAISREKGILIQ